MPVQTALAPNPAQLIAKYDGRAPRYTSYPTAVQFTPDVTPAIYRQWLAALPAHDPVSLYLHIPFCARLCWYCGCNTRAVNHHQPVGDYVQLLLQELELLETALPGRLPASAIHLGGGTPNMLSAHELSAIFDALKHTFRVAHHAEIAAELDPAILTRDWVRAAASHGLSRASLGVQNLDRQVQQAVNRHDTLEQIEAGVGWLRDAGVRSINLDLMYGLPHQTVENTLRTVDGLLALAPERIALFGYAHVPWMKSHQKLIAEAALPGAAERLDQSEAAAERLLEAGYVRIGLDHFALPTDELALAAFEGRLHRNFQGYTTDTARTLLGLGASAIGSLPQGQVQNITQELAWRGAVTAGELPIARGVALTDEDRFRGEIIERLMCDFDVDLAAICAHHHKTLDVLSEPLAKLEPFERDGLIRHEGVRLMVTERGRILVRSVCAAFDAYLAPDAQRHAKAI
ncbi:MAG: oxygen-independent coproporphyrinogen III oxidase [Phenylobacterium sp.]